MDAVSSAAVVAAIAGAVAATALRWLCTCRSRRSVQALASSGVCDQHREQTKLVAGAFESREARATRLRSELKALTDEHDKQISVIRELEAEIAVLQCEASPAGSMVPPNKH